MKITISIKKISVIIIIIIIIIIMEPTSSGISAGAGQTNDSRHWRHQGGDLSVPADVSGSSTG